MEVIRILENEVLLYAITDRRWATDRSLIEQVELALKGGVTMLQLREKDLPFEQFVAEAKTIKKICEKYDVPLIINDNVQVCLAADADGVHLGSKDIDIKQARSLLGKYKIIGATAKQVETAKQAESMGADYLGSGAVFGSETKSNAIKMPLQKLQEICEAVEIPVVAIGGIDIDNISQLKGRDISGVAIISGIFAAKDITSTCQQLKEKIINIVRE